MHHIRARTLSFEGRGKLSIILRRLVEVPEATGDTLDIPTVLDLAKKRPVPIPEHREMCKIYILLDLKSLCAVLIRGGPEKSLGQIRPRETYYLPSKLPIESRAVLLQVHS